jgi:AcrR family transcriptional regulator
VTRATAAQHGSSGGPDWRAAGPAPDQPPEAGSTRERILDVALDLFTEKGFDGTSLREIAEKFGFTN